MHCASVKIVIATASIFAAAVQAQGAGPSPAKPEMMESCPGLVAARPPFVPAAFHLAALERGQARLTYVGHSTFLIESPQLVRIATDYNDYVKPTVLPDIATMNHAHTTHYSLSPNPAIKYVLPGWSEDQKPARIDVQFKDVRVRNVPTNIRTYDGGTERHGNSIFIFEVANLCIAHLGHLHHTLTQQQLNEIGRVDVVLVPVDGSYTLDLDGMVVVLHAILAPIRSTVSCNACDRSGMSKSPRYHRWWCRRRVSRQSRKCWCCPAINGSH
jgi:hypothetical protein